MRLSAADKLPTFVIRTADGRKKMYEYMIQLIDAGYEFYLCNAVIWLTGIYDDKKLDLKENFPELYAVGPKGIRDRDQPNSWFALDDMQSRRKVLKEAIGLCHPVSARLLASKIAVMFLLFMTTMTSCGRKTFVGGHLTNRQRIEILEAENQNLTKNFAADAEMIARQHEQLKELLLWEPMYRYEYYKHFSDADSLRRELDGIHKVLQRCIMNGTYTDVRLDSLINVLRNNPWLNMKTQEFHPLPGQIIQLDSNGWQRLIEAQNYGMHDANGFKDEWSTIGSDLMHNGMIVGSPSKKVTKWGAVDLHSTVTGTLPRPDTAHLFFTNDTLWVDTASFNGKAFWHQERKLYAQSYVIMLRVDPRVSKWQIKTKDGQLRYWKVWSRPRVNREPPIQHTPMNESDYGSLRKVETAFTYGPDTLWVDTASTWYKTFGVPQEARGLFIIMLRVPEGSQWDVKMPALEGFPVRYWRVWFRPPVKQSI